MMDCIGYGKGGVKRGKSIINAPKVWIDLQSPSKDELALIKNKYKLHSLSIEECVKIGHRPKLHQFPNYTFLTFKAMDYAQKEKLHSKHIGIFLGKDFLITVHGEKCHEFEELKKQLLRESPMLVSGGSDYLLYAVLNAIIDDYLLTLDRIEDDLEELENLAAGPPHKRTVRQIFKMKKVNIAIRKILWPEREILSTLEKGGAFFVSKQNSVYFRQLHDHVFQTIDMNEGHRDVVTGILDIHLSSVSVSLNEVVKTLTVISAFVLVPTLIASVYGMNFVNMPEIKWGLGYLWALWLMGATTLFTYFWFKRKGWI